MTIKQIGFGALGVLVLAPYIGILTHAFYLENIDQAYAWQRPLLCLVISGLEAVLTIGLVVLLLWLIFFAGRKIAERLYK